MHRQFAKPEQIEGKLRLLAAKRGYLRRYAELMNARLGNELGETAHDILWAADRRSDELGDLARFVQCKIPHASQCRHDDLELMHSSVNALTLHFSEVGAFEKTHPWWGFVPTLITPGQHFEVESVLKKQVETVRGFRERLEQFRSRVGELRGAEEVDFFKKLTTLLTSVPPPPVGLTEQLLAVLFPRSDPEGVFTEQTVRVLGEKIECIKDFDTKSRGKLLSDSFNQEQLTKAKAQTETLPFGLSGRKVSDIAHLITQIRKLISRVSETLSALGEDAEFTRTKFEGNEDDLIHLRNIASIAKAAPLELLFYRRSSLANPLIFEKLKNAQSKAEELGRREAGLSELFYFDQEPDAQALQRAIHALREGDGFLRWLSKDWRQARKFYRSLLKNTVNHSGVECARQLSEIRELSLEKIAFTSNQEYSAAFGELFTGFKTDWKKIERLLGWYETSQKILLENSTRASPVDLTIFPEVCLKKLSVQSDSIFARLATLHQASRALERAFGPSFLKDASNSNRQKAWPLLLRGLESLSQACEESVQFHAALAPVDMTPTEICAAGEALISLTEMKAELESDADARRLLGPYFQGTKTDTTTISNALSWGRTLIEAGIPKEIRDYVFRCSPEHSLLQISELSDQAAQLHRELLELPQRLLPFGNLEWDVWHASALRDGTSISPKEMEERCSTALLHLDQLFAWSRYHQTRKVVFKQGFEPFVSMLETGKIPCDRLTFAFEFAFYNSIARSLFVQYGELRDFSGMTHEQLRAQFAALDKDVVNLNGKLYAHEIARSRTIPQGTTGPKAGDYTERHLLLKEIIRQRGHIPIRQLVKRAGNALKALKPCFMMGPLSVAQYLEPGAIGFDLVVMDEASQLRPEEAVGAVARGKQLIVVGDPKQLPPTSFFERMLDAGNDEDEDDEAANPALGTESILDICQQLYPMRTLRWHYRSQHESLIAFSNQRFYQGELIVFPSAYPRSRLLGLHFHHVQDGVYQSRQNLHEAHRVVDAVLEHILKHPLESLGVVTLNLTQRDLIDELLQKRMRAFPEGDAYSAKWDAEGWPLFIKNLENVQGDERDVIFISTTFGKVEGTDRVRQNFGPISKRSGWRRLNVLFTRARRSLHVFASLLPEDIVVDETTPEGTKALRDYLEYARTGLLAGIDPTPRPPDSDFEVSVGGVLRNKGFEVVYQLGVAGYFIDIVVRNPSRRGEFLAAIECDGASYHSGVSVRDRDRIRQEILEGLGWKGKIHRIWSTDWFRNRPSEITKLLTFLERKRKAAEEFAPSVEEEAAQEQARVISIEHLPAPEATLLPISTVEQLYAEVGDLVVYCDVASPETKIRTRIVEGLTRLEVGELNENAPLAKVLLGLETGDEDDLIVPGYSKRTYRLLSIERPSILATKTT